MQKVSNNLLKLLVIALATALSIFFHTGIVSIFPGYESYLEVSVVVPVVASVIYFFLLAAFSVALSINGIAKYFVKDAMICGTYVSLPSDESKIDLFELNYNMWSQRIELVGLAYVIDVDGVLNRRGSWKATKIIVSHDAPRIMYIYEGTNLNTNFQGPGFSLVRFDSSDFHEGVGYYIDMPGASAVTEIDIREQLSRSGRLLRSNYYRVSKSFRERINCGKWYWNTGDIALSVSRLEAVELNAMRPQTGM